MLFYTLKRFGVALLVLVTVSLVTFTLLRLSGDPAAAMAGESATEEDIEYVRKHYGFDKPLPVQYWAWATKALQGDLGRSVYLKRPVAQIVAEKAPVTMMLGACSLLFALALSIPLGVLAAMRPNTITDRTALTIAVIGQAFPSFFFALILILIFGVNLRLLPITGNDTWLHFVLPSIALGYYATPAIMRMTRAGMLDVLGSDYIRTAKAKGLRPPSFCSSTRSATQSFPWFRCRRFNSVSCWAVRSSSKRYFHCMASGASPGNRFSGPISK